MQLITELKDDALFLGKLYESAEIVEKCITETGIIEIRKRLPKIDKDANADEVKAKMLEQSKRNAMDIMKALMKDKPEYAVELMHSLIVLEEGETYPKGMALVTYGVKALINDEVLDFFISLMRLDTALSGV